MDHRSCYVGVSIRAPDFWKPPKKGSFDQSSDDEFSVLPSSTSRVPETMAFSPFIVGSLGSRLYLNDNKTIRNYNITIRNDNITIRNYNITRRNDNITIRNYSITIRNH